MTSVLDLLKPGSSVEHTAPTTAERKDLAKSGAAMPDGSFYIRNRSELRDAIFRVGSATPNAGESETARRNSVRRHIIRRAKFLKMEAMIPDTWNADGSLKQSGIARQVEDFLAHFGVLGMKWGVRRQSIGVTGARHVSVEAATAKNLQEQVRRSGTQSLSNRDLQTLVTRLNLERQYSQLNQQQVGQGRRFVNGILRDSGKALATGYILKYAPRGASFVAKKIGPTLARTSYTALKTIV